MEDDFTLLREFEYLMLVRIFLAQKNFPAALSLSDRMRRSAVAAGRRGALIEILLLQALAYQEMDNYSDGLTALGQALSLAEPEGYVRVFLDDGAPMAKLLRHAGSKGLTPKYISWLLTQFEGKALITPQPLIEPLSERELEILRLIASGKSNQEIAAQLVISIGTVKSHLSHIFNKLNVESRTQCVARARELKLLS
jgi:LuxR family maltose regulon positive regulatory protein